jgi:GNAT superfamily N-acetyltransferase
MGSIIREITNENSLNNSARVIRESFNTVAVEFDLTRENCPASPSFVTDEQLNELKSKGVRFFGLFLDSTQAGFIVVERTDRTLFWMEKLAVLPEYRHNGYGEKLVRYVFDYVSKRGGKRLAIGIIDEHTLLKNWYKEFGFQITSTRKFSHLPFMVCLMEMEFEPGPIITA